MTSRPAINVPPEHQSGTPEQLRKLARSWAGTLGPKAQRQLLDAAAEIEGGEEAYAVLVSDIRNLRQKLSDTERNLRATLDLLPGRSCPVEVRNRRER